MKFVNGIYVLFFVSFFLIACSESADQPTATKAAQSTANVQDAKIVDGVQVATLSWGKLNYDPEVIRLKADMPAKIVADTTRLTGCFRSFIVPDMDLRKSFNENDNTIEFMPTQKGTFTFGCSMGMGKGTLIVE